MKNKIRNIDIMLVLGVLLFLASGILNMIEIYHSFKVSALAMCLLYMFQFVMMLTRFASKSFGGTNKLSKVRIIGLIVSPISALLYLSLNIWQSYVLYYVTLGFGMLAAVPFIILALQVAAGKVTYNASSITTVDNADTAQEDHAKEPCDSTLVDESEESSGKQTL